MQNDKGNTILVPTDFTKIGDYAVNNAVILAKELGFSICILHVINKTTRKILAKENKTTEYINEKLIEIADKVKREHNIEVDYIAREGSIFSIIAEVAEEIKANYVVIGTHGKKGIQFLLGSFALKVIKGSPAPVFVVQKNPEKKVIDNIVFPLDLEEGSKQKVKWAIILFKQLNAKFHLFVYNQKDEFSQNRIKADLNQVKKIFDKHKISYTSTFSARKTSYYKQLINFAKKTNSDLLLMSTDPDKTAVNPFGSSHEKIIYNPEKFPIMCINSQELKILIGTL